MNLDFTDAVLIHQSSGFEHDDQLAFARMRRFYVNAEDPGARGSTDVKRLGWSGTTFQPYLHVAVGERLERVEPGEMNSEP